MQFSAPKLLSLVKHWARSARSSHHLSLRADDHVADLHAREQAGERRCHIAGSMWWPIQCVGSA